MTRETLRSLAKIALALALTMALTGVVPAAPNSHKPPPDVKTDAGYSSNPGHTGTGKIVATYCP